MFIVWGSKAKPDPFAIITVDGDQTKTTETKKNTSNPEWNEKFTLYVFFIFCFWFYLLVDIILFISWYYKAILWSFFYWLNIKFFDIIFIINNFIEMFQIPVLYQFRFLTKKSGNRQKIKDF